MKISKKILQIELNKSSTLLINPMTGAIDITPNKILKKIPDAEKKYLTERGYFLSEKERENQYKKLQKTNEKHSQNVPYRFYVLTTLNCNFGCPICYEKKSLENSETTLEKLEKIMQTIRNFQQEHRLPDNKIHLVIFGGEPLCVSNHEIIRYILESASQNNRKVIIVTNGSRVKDFIDIFVKYSKTISDFRITLDGSQEIHDKRRPYRGGQGSFTDVVSAIDLLLKNKLPIKMQTILGAGNVDHLEKLALSIKEKKWLENPYFQWRIEGSHDYANLDPQKDEISEGKMVKRLIELRENHGELKDKIKFESFKYLGHIVRSFGWLGEYKTYWGPKYSFCDPQKGFHYVFGTNGNIYHCPRTINKSDFCVGDTQNGIDKKNKLKHTSILDKSKCLECPINTLCGGGCVVQQKYYHDLDCKKYALSVIIGFIEDMKDKILEKADPDKIIPINDVW